MPTYPPRAVFFINSERVLVSKLRAGWELIGQSYRKGEIVEIERPDVIAFCLDRGTIEQVGVQPARYRLTKR